MTLPTKEKLDQLMEELPFNRDDYWVAMADVPNTDAQVLYAVREVDHTITILSIKNKDEDEW